MIIRSLKFSGFTLIEVLVAMVIGAIVIGLAISVFISFERVIKYTEAQNEINDELLYFSSYLRHDLEDASIVRYNGDELKLNFLDKGDIKYKLAPLSITRETQSMVDTFHLGLSITDIKTLDPKDSSIVHFTIEVEQNQHILILNLYKLYDNKTLLNSNDNMYKEYSYQKHIEKNDDN